MTCATVGCNEPTSGKSKYCVKHKRIARQKWLERVQTQERERTERYERFREAYRAAARAGTVAAGKCVPTPMVVVEHANQLDDSSPIVKQYEPIMDGVCGFAWINVSPGNSSFARWLTSNDLASKAYRGGVDIWVSEFGQSYELKMAYARAFAESLGRSDVGAKVYAGGRLD